jgi:GTP-binding protein EngB required for normal cell division
MFKDENTNTTLDVINYIAEKYSLTSIHKELESVNKLISQNSLINIAAVGQFKSGKSSFLNSLAGTDILPAGVIPVTSVLTSIEYGPNKLINVITNSGEEFQVSPSELKQYITEKLNPANFKNISRAIIKLPSLKDYKLLRFMDTPGINSIFLHNTETARMILPDTGAALITISSERPLSESDLKLLKTVSKYTPNIYIILTKTDLFDKNQLKEITEFIKKELKKYFSEEFEIFHFSIFKNKDYYKKIIQERILNKFSKEYQSERNKLIKYKTDNIIDRCSAYLNITYETALKKSDEKQKIRQAITKEKEDLKTVKQELALIANNYIQLTRNELENILLKYSEKLSSELIVKFKSDFRNWKGNLNQLSKNYINWIRDNLKSELINIIIIEEKYINNITSKALVHFEKYLEQFGQRFNSDLEKVLGIKIKTYNWKLSKAETVKPDISVTRVFDIPVDLFWFIFPAFLFRKFLLKHFEKEIRYDANKNIHRAISDLTEKINKEIKKISEESFSFINNEIFTIEKLLINNNLNQDIISIDLQKLNKLKLINS